MSPWSPEALEASRELAEELGLIPAPLPLEVTHRPNEEEGGEARRRAGLVKASRRNRMPIVQPGSSDAPEIEDGLYRATIKTVKERTLDKPDKFGNTDKFEIEIEFEDNQGETQNLNPLVNRKWSEKATLFLVAVACGIDAQPYEPFDTDELVGREVNVLIETEEEGKWPQVKSW